jgi:hypothetical protein
MALVITSAAAGLSRAAYEGPVPAPTDRFGRSGPYAVSTDTIPSPDWPGHVVTVLRPIGAVGLRPTWFLRTDLPATIQRTMANFLTTWSVTGQS